MVYLTLEQIIQLHALVLVKDGGADGMRNLGQLEADKASWKTLLSTLQ